MNELAIPGEVIQMQLRAGGNAGRAWLESLPGTVRELVLQWDLTLGPAFEGGCVGFVAPAERADGSQVVLKVNRLDDEETLCEADALVHWHGDGAVRLLDADPDRGALLLERLEPGTFLGDHPDREEAISIACSLLRRLWRGVPKGNRFPSVRGLALDLARELPDRFALAGRPFEARLLRRATELCEELAGSVEPSVIANRDFHLWNILAAQREPWLVIDPKPLVGERAFDTGHFLRSLIPETHDRPIVDRLVDRLAAELELDSERIRAWAFVRSVDDALWGREVGFSDVGSDLQIARLLA